jgi:hypothetical protein
MATITDIELEARALVDADTTSFPAAVMLRRINRAYEQVVTWIMTADGHWQWDDTNYTTFPFSTTDLVVSQNDYTLPADILELEKVSILDSSGREQFISAIDNQDVSVPLNTMYENDGQPIHYDKQGLSIIIYPAPATGTVTLANGLKVYYKRSADLFTAAQVSTGTKTPGFATPFHYVLSYMAAIPYAQSYKKDRVPYLLSEIERYRRDIEEHYGKRELDKPKRLSMSGISFR